MFVISELRKVSVEPLWVRKGLVLLKLQNYTSNSNTCSETHRAIALGKSQEKLGNLELVITLKRKELES